MKHPKLIKAFANWRKDNKFALEDTAILVPADLGNRFAGTYFLFTSNATLLATTEELSIIHATAAFIERLKMYRKNITAIQLDNKIVWERR